MFTSIVHAPPSYSFIPLSGILSHYVPYPVSPVFLTACELLQDKKLHCPWKGMLEGAYCGKYGGGICGLNG